MEKLNQEEPKVSRRNFLKGVMTHGALPAACLLGILETGKYLSEKTKEDFAKEQTPSVVDALNSMISGLNRESPVVNEKVVFTSENVSFLFSIDGLPHIVLSHDGETFFEGAYHDVDFYKDVAGALVDYLFDNELIVSE